MTGRAGTTDDDVGDLGFGAFGMFRGGGTFVLRSVLLATALSFIYSEQSLALGGGGGGGGGAAATTPPQPAQNTVAGSSISSLFSNPLDGVLGSTTNDTSPSPTPSQAYTETYLIQSLIGLGFSSSQAKLLTNEMTSDNFEFPSDYPPGYVSTFQSAALNLAGAIATLVNGGTPIDDPLGWGTVAVFQQFANSTGQTLLQVMTAALRDNVATMIGYTTIPFPTPYVYRGLYALPFSDTDNFLPDDVALAYASALRKRPPAPEPAPAPFQQRWEVWSSGFGGSNRTNDAGAAGVNTQAYGGIVGAEYRFSRETALGFALGGTGAHWQATGTGHSDAFQYAIYGRTHFGQAYLGAWLGGGTNSISTARFAGVDNVTASYTAQSYSGRLESGYRFAALPHIGVTPYAAVELQYVHTPSYSEIDQAGGGLGFNYGASNGTDTRSELGAHFDATQIVGTRIIVWSARAAWAHDWLSGYNVGSIFQAVPTVSFVADGSALLPHDSALTTLEGNLRLDPHWTAGARFDGQFASGFQTYAGTATLRYGW